MKWWSVTGAKQAKFASTTIQWPNFLTMPFFQVVVSANVDRQPGLAIWTVWTADRPPLAAAPKSMGHAVEVSLDRKCPIQVQDKLCDVSLIPWGPSARLMVRQRVLRRD